MYRKRKADQQTITEQSSGDHFIEEAVRKAHLTASNEFDYRKLARKQEGLLDCIVKEQGEELVFTYDIHSVTPWASIRKESRELLLAALIDVGKLLAAAYHYRFSLEPRNLYYDIQSRVYVKFRDVYGAEEECSPEDFLKQYKALIGCTLVRKYKYDDYISGGDDLLKEDKTLAEFAECVDTASLVGRLQREYSQYRSDHRKRFVEVARSKDLAQRLALILACIVSIALLAGFGYLAAWELPYQRAVMAANEAYLQSNYIAAVEALDPVAVSRMNVYQKYILAVSCVKCENFSDSNESNILNTLSLNGDEKLMEYWIHINRLDTEEAADIAMQESSEQLLYYAYLKERAVIENDASLSGQEKSSRLSEIEQKLQPLEEEYNALMEE